MANGEAKLEEHELPDEPSEEEQREELADEVERAIICAIISIPYKPRW